MCQLTRPASSTSQIGVGASAIGRLPQGYIQNEPATGTYARKVAAGELPVGRGKAFEGDDRLMGAAIERLMCDFEVDLDELADAFAEDKLLRAAAMHERETDWHQARPTLEGDASA